MLRTYRDTLVSVDSRSRRRRERIALATRLADQLNEPHGKQSKNARRIATEKPQLDYEPDDNGSLRPKGYTRSTISTLRPYGRATLYWHAKSRSFCVKVDASARGKSGRRLLLDQFVLVDGMVGRCACGGCGLFFAKTDPRMIYCSPACAARDRQRRRRSLARAARPGAKAAYQESQTRLAAQRQAIVAARAAGEYAREEFARASDINARRQQESLRRA
jgi:hypothetical protein